MSLPANLFGLLELMGLCPKFSGFKFQSFSTQSAHCCRSLRLHVPRAAERLLSHTVRIYFATAAKIWFPPFFPEVLQLLFLVDNREKKLLW